MSQIEHVAKIVGSSFVSESEIDKKMYESDASGAKGEASMVAWPASLDEVRQLIQFCKRSSCTIVPRGAGTGLAGGCVPNQSMVIDMSRMRSIIESGSDYVVVEAGMPLKELNMELRHRFFPIQPESREACTIGGMIATNATAMRAMEYGRMESWIEELNVFDGNGMYLTLKGDAIRHFCGSEGIFGIIARARLRVIETPKEKSTSLFSFNTLTAMEEKLDELKKDSDVRNIEFIDEACSGLIGLGEANHLIAEYENGRGSLKGKEAEELWAKREALPNILRENKHMITEDASIKEPAKFLNWLRKNQIACYGHIGIGTLHPAMKDSRMLEEMKSVLRQLGGKLGAEFGYGSRKKEHLDKEHAKRLHALKAYYDPKNIMNRGKLL